MKFNQKGFGAVVPLLGLIVVTLIVFTGYYIYNNQKSDQKISVEPSQSGKQSVSKESQFVAIKEWGLKAEAPSSLHLIYKMRDDANKYAEFTSTEVLAADPACDYGTGGGLIVRYSGTDMTEDGSQTIAQYAASSDAAGASYTKVGDKYYYFAHTQAGCSADAKVQDLQSSTNDAVKALVTKLQS